jgi:catechol 2,3-dioxygenase-like lactoylglutathione lyase family enzyme
MPIRNALASLAVRDLEPAVRWYERLLGRTPDDRSIETVAEWKFERGGGLQVYQLPERAGNGSVTFAVSNIDTLASHLQKCSIDPAQRSSGPTLKTIMIMDPDGNHIAFAETLSPRPEQATLE